MRGFIDATGRIPIGIQGDKVVTPGPRFARASVELVSGTPYMYREQKERYVPVKFSTRGGSAIIEAQEEVADKARPVPTTGQFSRRGTTHAIALAGAAEAR